MAWQYAVFTVMCPECDLEQTAALAAEVGLDGLEWRVANKAPEPINRAELLGGEPLNR
jgi:phage terminase large subunit GpA-like protein